MTLVLHLGAKARSDLRARIPDPEGRREWKGPDRALLSFAPGETSTAWASMRGYRGAAPLTRGAQQRDLVAASAMDDLRADGSMSSSLKERALLSAGRCAVRPP